MIIKIKRFWSKNNNLYEMVDMVDTTVSYLPFNTNYYFLSKSFVSYYNKFLIKKPIAAKNMLSDLLAGRR